MSTVRDHFVYRTYGSEGELLYVGCTKRLDQRWYEHKLEKSQMYSQTVRCRLQGPYTRDVARRIERDAIREEQPLHGWTPIKGEERRKRSRWTKNRVQELIAEGAGVVAAVHRAVAECDELFPDPYAHLWAVS